MFPYASTVVLSAFLLFLIQPLIGKQVLPWFGGSAAVWTTCLLFFQGALLAGYGYAYVLVRWLKPRVQLGLHAALLAVALATLPIIADASWKPSGAVSPEPRILGLLAVTIGLPYVLLSATSPLLQAWHWRRHRSGVPYRLFAWSNLASLLGLLGYPFLIEPYLGVKASAGLWSVLFAVFAVACVATGLGSIRAAERGRDEPAGTTAADEPLEPLGTGRRLAWLLLSALGSAFLLAVSNHITQDIASVPFLWVVPLAIYLLTFILCFDHPRWYARPVFLPLFGVSLVGMAAWASSLELLLVVPLHLFGLFAACMVCHGELARLKPHPSRLTGYFLLVAAGGAAGALLVAVAAPRFLRGYYEMQLALALLAVLLAVRVWRLKSARPAWRWMGRAVALGVVALVVWFDAGAVRQYTAGVRVMERSFHGVVRTLDYQQAGRFRALFHGSIDHGGQHLDPDLTMEPTSYFSRTSGYGRVLSLLSGPRHVGVIGLGAGALLTHSRRGDTWVFYEIDPLVVEVAAREFTFQRETAAKVEVVLGDGRLSLEREPSRQYDLLAVDAFSGDSIPLHLITREAMAIYVRHLKPDGVIVFQATNRHVDLLPVIRALADEFGLQTAWVSDWIQREDPFTSVTDQVVVTRNRGLLEAAEIRHASEPAPRRPGLPVFTDDFCSLLSILKW